MLIVSEVAQPGKLAKSCLLLALGLFFFETSQAFASKDSTAEKLGDCNWQVTYRGRRYDLSPLTRSTLSRPIETDIRFALERVPEANKHLENLSAKLQEARGHTIIASILISGLVVAKLLQGRVTNAEENREYQFATVAGAGFALTAALFSWKSTHEAKQELVSAVEEFNEHSPHKIEPASASVGVAE